MTLFTNVSKLHMVAGLESVSDACFLVSKNGVIEWCGPKNDFKSFAAGKSPAWRKSLKKVSLKEAEVLPAFTECHTHLLYAGSRADEFERRNRGDSYLDIQAAGGGIQSTVKATGAASARELEAGVRERLAILVAQGVTTVEIKTGYAATIEEELRHLNLLLKLRKESESSRRSSSARPPRGPRLIVTCLAAHSIPKGETEASWLKKVETLLPTLKSKEVRLDIFVEKGAFSIAAARALYQKAKALKIHTTVHADQLTLSGGTELGLEMKSQSVDHVIEIGEKEIAALAKSETVAVLLPVADMYTKLPYPKARAMIDAGVRVALATDHNPGTSPALDVGLVGVLARTLMQMTLPEVLQAYTVHAAAALGQAKSLGVLKPGFLADFLVLKPGAGLTDLFYAVGPGVSHSAVGSVWSDGRRIWLRPGSR